MITYLLVLLMMPCHARLVTQPPASTEPEHDVTSSNFNLELTQLLRDEVDVFDDLNEFVKNIALF